MNRHSARSLKTEGGNFLALRNQNRSLKPPGPVRLYNMEFDGSLLLESDRDVKLVTELDIKQRMTLHCQHCNTVLGDSLGVCGELKCMDSIMCLKVTDDVVMSDSKESGHRGEMANCIYSSLKCRGCRSAVGKVIHASPSHLAAMRSIFLLHKSNISCYILSSSSMVKASELTFEVKVFKESITEARQQFEAQLDQMLCIKSRLADRSVSTLLHQ
ncbi:protein Mis18-beta [Notolabrus celidotus]|uniref:protein Mis18-beta n=1 Tax=Notolabrus celidotus TaxID=1203425 RepID=UPI00148FDCCF|nr:protein Mis18-beta [Notolabrus celidotus]